MKKNILIAISMFFIMTISICLTGCSVPNDSVTDKNHPSPTSQTKDTSKENPTISPNQPTPTERVTAIKPSSSPSDGNAIDYTQYIHKIWINRSLMNSENQEMSFYISNITNGKLVGKSTINGLHGYCIPDIGHLGEMDYADLTGIIKNDIADCDSYASTSGARGNYEFKFKSDDVIEVTFIDLNESYKYEPLTIKDVIESGNINKNQSFTVNLNSWGTVNFVTCEMSNAPTFFLTNKEGDILYYLNLNLMTVDEIKAVSFKDVNKDGLKDIIIIAANKNDSSNVEAYVILQQADGSFDVDDELNSEINDSGNNKSIKAITDYLSKKL
ncbi:MAG TPA: hypothetical protein VN258_20890 [Mobilitalea sp.]|nr:hypothetical protein [Mobilitalea sp.]